MTKAELIEKMANEAGISKVAANEECKNCDDEKNSNQVKF